MEKERAALEESIAQRAAQREVCEKSTEEALEKLRGKIGVAQGETDKWADNAYLLAQVVKEESG